MLISIDRLKSFFKRNFEGGYSLDEENKILKLGKLNKREVGIFRNNKKFILDYLKEYFYEVPEYENNSFLTNISTILNNNQYSKFLINEDTTAEVLYNFNKNDMYHIEVIRNILFLFIEIYSKILYESLTKKNKERENKS